MTISATGAQDIPALAHRNQTALFLPKGAGALDVMDGVAQGLELTKTSGMGYSIGPGRGAVNCASIADGSMSYVVVDAEGGSFDPGDASYSRIDTIVVEAHPELPASSGVALKVVSGTPAASPSRPALQPGQSPLYDVTILAGASAANGGWDASKVLDRRVTIGGGAPITKLAPSGGNAGWSVSGEIWTQKVGKITRVDYNLLAMRSSSITLSGTPNFDVNIGVVFPPGARGVGMSVINNAAVSGAGLNSNVHTNVNPGTGNISLRSQSLLTIPTSGAVWISGFYTTTAS